MAFCVAANTHFLRSRKEWNLSEYVAVETSPGAPPRSGLSLAVSESEQDVCLARRGGEEQEPRMSSGECVVAGRSVQAKCLQRGYKEERTATQGGANATLSLLTWNFTVGQTMEEHVSARIKNN